MQQPIVQYQELMNATIDTALQRPTWGRKLSPYGQPGAENYRHSFLPQVGRGTSSIRSHLGKSSRKYRWPRRKCLEEIYKRSKGKQKVIRSRSNVLQQLFWTIYLTGLSLDVLVITLRSGSLSLKLYTYFSNCKRSIPCEHHILGGHLFLVFNSFFQFCAYVTISYNERFQLINMFIWSCPSWIICLKRLDSSICSFRICLVFVLFCFVCHSLF